MNKKLEKIYIFDFDHTLFNAQKFREDLGLLISQNKNIITEKIWEAFMKQDKRILFFIKEKSIDYLFPEVEKNLKKIKGQKILLSFGNLKYQQKKIIASGIDRFFNKVILTEEHKNNFLKKFVLKHKKQEIFFINDNYNKRFSENKEIAEKIPQIKILEVDNYLPEKNQTISEIFLKLLKLGKLSKN